MVTVVRMPQLGLTMEKGTVGVWLKKVGDPVTSGEPICEILTDKVDAQVEAPGTGVLRKIVVSEGGRNLCMRSNLTRLLLHPGKVGLSHHLSPGD